LYTNFTFCLAVSPSASYYCTLTAVVRTVNKEMIIMVTMVIMMTIRTVRRSGVKYIALDSFIANSGLEIL